MSHTEKYFVHEGPYAAEFQVTSHDDGSPWSPIVAKEDVFKADRIRLALRRGDLEAAAKEAKVFELRLLAGE